MSATISVFDPTALRPTEGQQELRTLDALKGKVVGFIDNSKRNFNYLADDMAELLKTRHGVKSTLIYSKRTPTIPAPEEVMQDFVSQCDLVITGSGD